MSHFHGLRWLAWFELLSTIQHGKHDRCRWNISCSCLLCQWSYRKAWTTKFRTSVISRSIHGQVAHVAVSKLVRLGRSCASLGRMSHQTKSFIGGFCHDYMHTSVYAPKLVPHGWRHFFMGFRDNADCAPRGAREPGRFSNTGYPGAHPRAFRKSLEGSLRDKKCNLIAA